MPDPWILKLNLRFTYAMHFVCPSMDFFTPASIFGSFGNNYSVGLDRFFLTF